MLARWVSVQGLNQPEMRLLVEKVSNQPETWDIEDKLAEFSLPSWQVITQWLTQLMNDESRLRHALCVLPRAPVVVIESKYSDI